MRSKIKESYSSVPMTSQHLGGFTTHQEISIRFMAAMLSNPKFADTPDKELAFEAINCANIFIETYNQ